MTARGGLGARLRGVVRSVLGWLDDTVKGRRALAQTLDELRETERLLSDQIALNGRLMARQSYGTAGDAE